MNVCGPFTTFVCIFRVEVRRKSPNKVKTRLVLKKLEMEEKRTARRALEKKEMRTTRSKRKKMVMIQKKNRSTQRKNLIVGT